MSETVYIGVGSNIDPEVNILKAFDMLQDELRIVAVSACYSSAPLGRPEQHDFINCVWKVKTNLSPETIKFKILRDIETLLGRVRSDDKYAPRPIDLDLLLYNNYRMYTERMTIPDPDITHRNFIAVPLLELAPDIIIPGCKHPLSTEPAALDKCGLTAMTELTMRLKERIKHEH